MKTTKFLLIGTLLCTMTTFTCYGGRGVLVKTSESGIIGTLSGATDITTFTAKFQKYMDPVKLAAFITAYEANQKSASPMGWEGFVLDYATKNPTFQTEFLAALKKYQEDEQLSDSDLGKSISEQIAELKKQIDDMEKLSKEEKDKYKELLDKYENLSKEMAKQLGNANNALADALKNSTKPQGMDPMMLIMMIMMMMMMMGQGGGGGGAGGGGGGCGGGGGGCSGGGCPQADSGGGE